MYIYDNIPLDFSYNEN